MAEHSEEIERRIRAAARAGKHGILEDWAAIWPASTAKALMAAEAEIERLREALERIAEWGGSQSLGYEGPRDTARAALSDSSEEADRG